MSTTLRAGDVWRRVAIALVASRVVLALVLWLVWWLDPSLGASFSGRLRHDFTHWDSLAYLRIAESGYPNHLSPDDAYLPLYPLLVGVAGRIIGDYIVAGLLVSTVAEAVALYFCFRLVERERGEFDAMFAMWLLAFAVFGFFLAAIYTESLFVAAAAAALYFARQGLWSWAALAAALSCATRVTGIAVVAALLVEYVVCNRARLRPQLALIVLSLLPLVVFAAYLDGRVGDALAPLHVNQRDFHESLAWPWVGLANAWQTMMGGAGDNRFIFFREVSFGLLGIVFCIAAWFMPRFARSLAAYCSVVMLMTISLLFWRSVPRYELALFPLLIIVADLTRGRREVRGALVGVSAVLMAWGGIIFASGRWLG